MRAVIQRVSEACVKTDNKTIGKISWGLVVLLGIEDTDTVEDAEWQQRQRPPIGSLCLRMNDLIDYLAITSFPVLTWSFIVTWYV